MFYHDTLTLWQHYKLIWKFGTNVLVCVFILYDIPLLLYTGRDCDGSLDCINMALVFPGIPKSCEWQTSWQDIQSLHAEM